MTANQLAKFYTESGAARERARIRRLIGPALQSLRDTAIYLVRNGYDIPAIEIGEAIAPIDAATKPEPQRKRGTK